MPVYKYSAVYRKLNPRKFIAYGIGLEKSGTHSLAAMFSRHYRSQHELGVGEINPLAVNYLNGSASSAELMDALQRRDRYAWLEMDASHPHIHYLSFLLKINPDAKFILTFREPVAWLNSVFNQHIHRGKRPYFDLLHTYRYNVLCTADYAPEDCFLSEKYGLFPLASYLAYWKYHIHQALTVIPHDQLLLISTANLKTAVDKMAAFLGVPSGTIDPQQSHAYKAVKKDPIVDEVDQDYLRKLIDHYCKDTLATLHKAES